MIRQRLLIMACSAAKDPSTGLLPAIERYRPGAYAQILHQVPQASWPEVVILSARFGYMNAWRPLPDYNVPMDRQAMRLLKEDPEVWAQLATMIRPWHTDIFVAAGGLYREVIDYHRSLGVFRPEAVFTVASGGIGQQRAQLKGWLAQKEAA
jgi:hypothetical protein